MKVKLESMPARVSINTDKSPRMVGARLRTSLACVHVLLNILSDTFGASLRCCFIQGIAIFEAMMCFFMIFLKLLCVKFA